MPFTGIKEPVFRQGLDISCAAFLHHIRVWPGEEKHALAWKERNTPHDIFPLECAVYDRFDRRNKKPARIPYIHRYQCGFRWVRRKRRSKWAPLV